MTVKKQKPRQIILSKRANVFYIEHARVLKKDDRVVFLTDTNEEVENFFNIPERNTAFLLLGKGTSITDAAARKLAESNVLVGFSGSGGSPFFSITDPVFLSPQSEYRPTEYMQEWVLRWFDEKTRLDMARQLLIKRIIKTHEAWEKNQTIGKRSIGLPRQAIKSFSAGIKTSQSQQDLLLAESRWAKSLYATLAQGFGIKVFRRDEGVGGDSSPEEVINSYLDHGNYIAYGYAAVALNGLGISYSLPLLHGKTRRGALVFDIADLVKDAYVMPLAFAYGVDEKKKPQDFRETLIETCQQNEVLDQMFDFVKALVERRTTT